MNLVIVVAISMILFIILLFVGVRVGRRAKAKHVK